MSINNSRVTASNEGVQNQRDIMKGYQKKGRDLTRSYDKASTPTEKSKKQRDNTKTPQIMSITQQLRTD